MVLAKGQGRHSAPHRSRHPTNRIPEKNLPKVCNMQVSQRFFLASFFSATYALLAAGCWQSIETSRFNEGLENKKLFNCQSLPQEIYQPEAASLQLKQWRSHLTDLRSQSGHSPSLTSYIGILDMIVSSISAQSAFTAICDSLGRIQAVAIGGDYDSKTLAQTAADQIIDEDVIYLSLLASRPSGMGDKQKGAGLEAIAELLRSEPSARALALDPTDSSRNFYRKFGFYFGESFTIAIDRDEFFQNYRAYYQSCKSR